MKKAWGVALFIVISIILPFISCKTVPSAREQTTKESVEQPPQAAEKPPITTQPEEISQELQDKLNAAVTAADEARKKAVDFEAPSYFPSEWENVQVQYETAGQMPRENDADAQSAITAYEATAASFGSVFEIAVPLYAQAREDEIMMARNNLIGEGVQESLSDYHAYLDPADDTALAALNQYETGDYYAARDSAARALMMYQTVQAGYSSWILRDEILMREFEDYDRDNFDRGREVLSDAADIYKSGNIANALKNALDAQERYNIVLQKGWIAYSELRFSLADAERQAALDVKADVAAKDLFREADSLYTPGITEMENKNYEEAVRRFTSAQALFVMAGELATEKRQRAVAAIREASDKIEESSETAKQAEIAIEGIRQ